MRFCILDPHAFKAVKDDPGLILDWPADEIVTRAHPVRRRFEPIRSRRRKRLAAELFRALDDMKRDLYAH